jgi:Pyruvate/2-oxoacid:ferredoxin oxidoreductase delta subunit
VKRNLIVIDESKCNGCGQCVSACAEGALKLVDGKARLVSDVYCDGLGACIGECPTGALTIQQRDAEGFDEQAVRQRLGQGEPSPAAEAPAAEAGHVENTHGHGHSGCPGAAVRQLKAVPFEAPCACPSGPAEVTESALANWPVQLSLVPPTAPIFRKAHLLVCADCVAYALPDFQRRLLAGRSVVIGCPKLDDVEAYTQKLTAILAGNEILSVTVAHMEVPCCGGIVRAVLQALAKSGRTDIAYRQVLVHIDGKMEQEVPQGCPGGCGDD